MPISASPAIQLSADGVTWLAPGAPLQVAPGATWYARLNSIGNVGSTTWAVLSTDDVGTAPALTSAGIASSTCSGVAGAAGTAFILQSTINGMVDPTTNTTNPLTTQATAKVWVPAANGNQVLCYDEHAEAGPQWWMPLVNAAIRGAAGGGGSQLQGGGSTVSVSANGIFYTPALKLTTPSNTLTIVTTIPLATGSDLILDLNFKARSQERGTDRALVHGLHPRRPREPERHAGAVVRHRHAHGRHHLHRRRDVGRARRLEPHRLLLGQHHHAEHHRDRQHHHRLGGLVLRDPHARVTRAPPLAPPPLLPLHPAPRGACGAPCSRSPR